MTKNLGIWKADFGFKSGFTNSFGKQYLSKTQNPPRFRTPNSKIRIPEIVSFKKPKPITFNQCKNP